MPFRPGPPRLSVAAALAVLLTAATIAPAPAAVVVAPNAQAALEGGSSSRFPFFTNRMRYQQVFAASEFAALSGPTPITEIAFRCNATDCPAFDVTVTASIWLSTTPNAPDGLNGVFFNNIGLDQRLVKSGAITLASAGTTGGGPNAFDIVIDIDDGFVYDPSAGNLLLDIQMTAGPGSIGVFLDAVSAFGDAVSHLRSADPRETVGTPGTVGLVTRFGVPDPVTPVPLPPTAPTLAAGLGLLVLLRRFARGRPERPAGRS